MKLNRNHLYLAFLVLAAGAGLVLFTAGSDSNSDSSQAESSTSMSAEADDGNPLDAPDAMAVEDWDKEGVGLEPGDTAPDFYYHTIGGEKARLSDLRGKRVMLNFWATWCPKCEREMPHMNELRNKHADEWDFEIVAVATPRNSSLEKVRKTAADRELTFPVTFDADSDVWNVFNAEATPTSYFIDPDGTITERYVGPLTMEQLEDRLKPEQDGDKVVQAE